MASTARLDELKKKFDENPRRYFAPLANEHRKSGDLDQAIALCRTHLPQQPGHISGHIVLAQALYEAGSLDESREIFHTALGLDPENLIALRYLGDIARDTADVETARSWYQRVLEVDPRNDEIVQMVRDLDAPRAAPEAVEASTAEAPSSFAPPTPEPAPPIAPPAAPAVNNDARFAPLSIEEIELDETVGQESAEAASEASEALPATSFDVDGSWDVGTPSASPLEAPGTDAFDFDPAAGADDLFAAPGDGETHDFFLSELSGTNVPQDGSLPSDAPDAWAPAASADTERAEPAAPAAPTEGAVDESAEFEEGAFYLEPPPAAPGEGEPSPAGELHGNASDHVAVDAPTPPAPMPNEAAATASGGMDAFAAEYYAPVEPAPASITAAFASTDAVDSSLESAPAILEPNEPAVAELAGDATEQPTAERQQPTPEMISDPPASHETLGLEVMEFVSPGEQQPPSATHAGSADMDPAIGRVPQTMPSEARVAPAAFVTETMAELYLQQGFRNEALEVYRELLARNPSDASLRERIAQIESGSISSVGMAMVSEDVVESALKRQSARPARSVRSFFASIASRRAPMQPAHERSEQPSETRADAGSAQLSYDTGAAAAPEPAPAYEEPAVHQPELETTQQPRAARITPLMSAAETLATFDPFADTTDATEPDAWSGLAPNDAPAFAEDAAPAMPVLEPVVARTPTPAATPVASTEPSPARRGLEDLFPDTPVTARTEAAAQTFATAFGRPEPQGRPTRAASSELSLDHVFRGAPEGGQPADGGFSFDQFFSDSRGSSADPTTPAASTPDLGRGGSGDANDIEQFTAWLEGLKKK